MLIATKLERVFILIDNNQEIKLVDLINQLKPENAKCNFCTGCFTGEYPIRVPKEMPKDKFERKIDE